MTQVPPPPHTPQTPMGSSFPLPFPSAHRNVFFASRWTVSLRSKFDIDPAIVSSEALTLFSRFFTISRWFRGVFLPLGWFRLLFYIPDFAPRYFRCLESAPPF